MTTEIKYFSLFNKAFASYYREKILTETITPNDVF